MSIIAKSQPQAAYSAFINGYRHKFTYYVLTIPNIAHLLKPIEDIIASDLLPQILGFEVSLLDREIFALPTRLGGLGIQITTTEADSEYNASRTLSAPLAALIVTQNMFALPDEEITHKHHQQSEARANNKGGCHIHQLKSTFNTRDDKDYIECNC